MVFTPPNELRRSPRCSTRTSPRKAPPLLVAYEDAPKWARYPFVRAGYRRRLTLRDAFISAFYIHNETFNIWTHAVGCAYILWRLAALYLHGLGSCGPSATGAVLTYYVAALFCLTSSTTYHLFGGVSSKRTHDILLRIDMLGIGALIAGSCVPGLLFTFRDRPLAGVGYFALMASFALAAAACPSRRQRLLSMATAIGVVPAGDWTIHATSAERAVHLAPFIGMFACYGIGLAIFFFRVPERLNPGAFDRTPLLSHSCWHVCVLAAILSWDEFCTRFAATCE